MSEGESEEGVRVAQQYSDVLKRGLTKEVGIINESIRKIEKIQNRVNRKENLIVGNVEEKGNDLDKIRSIISEALECPDTNIKEVKRIGRKIEGKNRLILVTLGTLREKIEILNNGSKLREKSVFVAEDLSREERVTI